MNSVDPQAYMSDLGTKIVARHPVDRTELQPFAHVATAEKAAV